MQPRNREPVTSPDECRVTPLDPKTGIPTTGETMTMTKTEFRAAVRELTGIRYRDLPMHDTVRIAEDMLVLQRKDIQILRSARDGSFYRVRWTL